MLSTLKYFCRESIPWIILITILSVAGYGLYWIWNTSTFREDDKQCQQVGYQVVMAGQSASMARIAHDACMKQKGH